MEYIYYENDDNGEIIRYDYKKGIVDAYNTDTKDWIQLPNGNEYRRAFVLGQGNWDCITEITEEKAFELIEKSKKK